MGLDPGSATPDVPQDPRDLTKVIWGDIGTAAESYAEAAQNALRELSRDLQAIADAHTGKKRDRLLREHLEAAGLVQCGRPRECARFGTASGEDAVFESRLEGAGWLAEWRAGYWLFFMTLGLSPKAAVDAIAADEGRVPEDVAGSIRRHFKRRGLPLPVALPY